jgi:hypothetical protein
MRRVRPIMPSCTWPDAVHRSASDAGLCKPDNVDHISSWAHGRREMNINPFWRDLAALWGAALSTFIFVARFIPSRPIFEIERGQPPTSDLTLRVINPSKSMRVIRERFRFKLSGKGHAIGISTGRSRTCDVGTPGTLLLAIKGEDEQKVEINCLNEADQGRNGRWLVCFTWRGSWILPLGIPAFVYVSTKRAAELNAAV